MLSGLKGAIWREFHTCTFELIKREELHQSIPGYENLRYGALDFLRCVKCGRRETERLYERRVTDQGWWVQRGKLPPNKETWTLDAPDTKRVDGGAGQG